MLHSYPLEEGHVGYCTQGWSSCVCSSSEGDGARARLSSTVAGSAVQSGRGGSGVRRPEEEWTPTYKQARPTTLNVILYLGIPRNPFIQV